MASKTKSENPNFLKNIGDELFEMNARKFVRDVDLGLLPIEGAAEPYQKVTHDITVGYVSTPDFSPVDFITNEDTALRFAPDATVGGSNWVSFEMPVVPNGNKCAFVVQVNMGVDRVVYPDVFVRNTHTGVDFRPNKVAVLSPKASEMFLVINLDNVAENDPHTFTMIFTTGSFDLKISSITYVSM